MKKFAFILMGAGYDPEQDTAEFQKGESLTSIFTVRNMEEATRRAEKCAADGYGVIELCGAFGEEGARRIREATGNRIGVGYVVHDPAQDAIFTAFFGGK